MVASGVGPGNWVPTRWRRCDKASNGTFSCLAADQQARSSRRRLPRVFGWSGTWALTTDPGLTLDEEALAPDPIATLEDAKESSADAARPLRASCAGSSPIAKATRCVGAKVFPALRLMELAGEVLAGYFFTELSGPQFVTPAAFAQLQQAWSPPEHFWVNAVDPVAPCGLGLKWADLPHLPPRRIQNYLAFYEGQLALVVENNGQRLQFELPPEHAALVHVCAPLEHLVARRKRVEVAQINGQPSRERPILRGLGAHVPSCEGPQANLPANPLACSRLH